MPGSIHPFTYSGGVLCVVAVLVSGLWLPRFVRYDARHIPVSSVAPNEVKDLYAAQ